MLGFVLRGQDGQHGRKGLAGVGVTRKGIGDGLWNRLGQVRQHALAGASTQRHWFDGRLHHVLGPAKCRLARQSATDARVIEAARAKATG